MKFVVEIMRPLPLRRFPDVPDFVAGISVIRGQPTPVVHLGVLFEGGEPVAPSRLVSLRFDGRTLALAVDGVPGARWLDGSSLNSLPPLLGEGRASGIQSLGALDAELLVVLSASRILPGDLWRSMIAKETGPCP